MQGGLAGNELGVIIGGPGAGKSMVLVHLGAAAVKAGKNIVHITLELGKRSVGTRYDSWFTKYPIDKIPFFRSDVKEKLMSMREGMGSLKIQEYPTKSASILKLKAYVNKLKATGFKADMIIIDYADLLRPSGNNN
jgi:replicative DNA helicase